MRVATKLDELSGQAAGLRSIRRAIRGKNGAAAEAQVRSTMEIVRGPQGVPEANELLNAAAGGRVTRSVGPLVEGYARAERKVARPSTLNPEQRSRYLDRISRSMKDAQARIEQQLGEVPHAREMVASIDEKIADFEHHKQAAIADRRQMTGQLERAKAVEREMRSLGPRLQQRERELKELTASNFHRCVKADLRTTRGMIDSGEYAITDPARERAEVLSRTVPELDTKQQAYLDAKGRGAPGAEVDRALDDYYRASIGSFNYARESGARESAALDRRIQNLDRAIGAARFVRDGSFAVGAMLIPGAQGVGAGSAAAAVGALGLMKTGLQLADERPDGGRWTSGAAGRALVSNTAHLGVDALGGAGYLKLGKEMMVAGSTLQKGRLLGETGALSIGSGTAHRSIDGQGWSALDPKKLALDGGVGVATFGLNAKISPALANAPAIARHTANTVVGGATGAGAQVASNAIEGRPLEENVDVATLQGAGAGLATSVAMGRQLQAIEEAAMPDAAYAKALQPRIRQAVEAYRSGDYRAVQRLLTDRAFAGRIGVRLDVKSVGVTRDPRTLTAEELDSIATAARTNSMSWTDKKVEIVDAFFVPKEGVHGAATSGDVPAVGKQLTPIMLEEWMHQLQNASGRPLSKLTQQYLNEKGLKWSPEYHEMDIIASFYEWGFPVDSIGTVHAYPERKAFADWYRTERGGAR